MVFLLYHTYADELIRSSSAAYSPQVPTSSLPDGVSEDEMKDAKTHKVGHIALHKKK
jgi:hypothetical protein